VKTDEAHRIYPVISLFALAPGTTEASGHIAPAGHDHAPLFWEEVADFFKGDPYVIFSARAGTDLGLRITTRLAVLVAARRVLRHQLG